MKLRFPGFKILDRYILGKFLATYFFAIAMIIVVVVLFDYVEKIDDFTELHAPLNEVIFDYYLNFIPFFINQFSGLFTFIACIFFTSKMAYQTEIVAMLSGGMSFRRLMWPYFLGALIIGSLSLTLNLWLIPISQRHIVNFESQYIKRKQNAKFNRHIYRQIEPGTFAQQPQRGLAPEPCGFGVVDALCAAHFGGYVVDVSHVISGLSGRGRWR